MMFLKKFFFKIKQLMEPLERVLAQLAVAQRDMRATDERLAAMCLTRQAQFVTTAGVCVCACVCVGS